MGFGANRRDRIVILSGFYYPDTPQNAVDELQAIFASATFELP